MPARRARTRYAQAALVLSTLMPGLACDRGNATELWSAADVAEERTLLQANLEVLWTAGGDVADTLLQLPRVLRADTGIVVLFDDGGARLLAFDPETGALRWTYGRSGGGPDEFGNVRDVRLDGQGRIVVHDIANARITVLDRNREVIRRIGVDPIDHAEQFVPVGDDRFAFITNASSTPLVTIDGQGRVLSRGDLPWRGFNGLSFLARQGAIASEHDRWAYAFSFGNGWFPYQGEQAAGPVGRFVEHTPFPEPITQRIEGGFMTTMPPANCSACSVSLSDSILYVHFGGSGEKRNRLLDLFRWDTAEYVGTVELPWAPRTVFVARDRLYALRFRPAPQLVAASFRWIPASKARP